MKITETTLPGVLVIEPRVFTDDRGWFCETYHQDRFREHGIASTFVQDNHSSSTKGVVRGLHFQEPNPQGKLVRCVKGGVFDVAVDIRVGSPSFGKWVGVELTEENRTMLWIPEGFAHGFCALTDVAEITYKCTAFWEQAHDRSLLWNDPDIGIAWPVTPAEAVLSPKDAAAPRLIAAPVLPTY
ncbi:MAG TPA: dTDP-4-dehydrorhamnose 3,5-epimerase [Thermoanaerobaculia bacterium]